MEKNIDQAISEMRTAIVCAVNSAGLPLSIAALVIENVHAEIMQVMEKQANMAKDGGVADADGKP